MRTGNDKVDPWSFERIAIPTANTVTGMSKQKAGQAPTPGQLLLSNYLCLIVLQSKINEKNPNYETFRKER